jgi:hypothetical protein
MHLENGGRTMLRKRVIPAYSRWLRSIQAFFS